MSANAFQIFQDHFPMDRTRPFMTVPNGPVITYADLEHKTAQLANLLSRLDIQPGDRVAVQVEKSPEAILLYLACLRAGVIYLPMNMAYQPDELAYFIENAEPTLIVCDQSSLDLFKRLCAGNTIVKIRTLQQDGTGSLMRGASKEEGAFTTKTQADDDTACILYSSGTTGRPKGIMLSHKNLISNARALHEYWGFQPDDVLLHALPIFHAHGLFVAINTALLNGGSMIFLNKFDTQAICDHLPQATLFMGVPTFYTRLLKEPRFTKDLCAHMRLFISGSAPLLEETFEAFTEHTGHRILERYGMTETGMNTSNPLDGDRVAGTVGFALPGITARVTNEAGEICAPDDIGMVEIKGPNVFTAYWRMPEKTAEDFTDDGFFQTGDLGKMDTDGRLTIVGREKDMIISGGFNVYPKEIELVVDDLPGVLESAIVGLPHPDFGEAGLAVVVKDGSCPIDESIILNSLKDHLANFKVPKKVIFLDELPRNTMGKVQKNLLRTDYKNLLS